VLRLLLGLFGASWLATMRLAAIVVPGGEPFWIWTGYFFSWGSASIALALLVTIAGALYISIPIAVEGLGFRTDRAIAAGLLVAWWFVPVVALWSVASLIHASYNPSFNGPLSTGPLSARWQPFFAFVGHWLWSIPLMLIAVSTMISTDRRFKARLLAKSASCPNCGYPTDGLPSPVCPECGGSIPRAAQACGVIRWNVGK
jgi:hypothetical protein